jgi:HSP20 family protein
VDEGDKFIVRTDLPGFSKDNINIEITDDSIELSGDVEKEKKKEKENYRHYERSYSSFRRSLIFPEKVKPKKATAAPTNGVLEVKVPKEEPTEPEGKHKVQIQ